MQKVFVYLAYLFFVFILCILNQLVMKKGDKIYIPSALYIDHGEDDIQGGWAIVESIKTDEGLPKDNSNRTFVTVEGIDVSYNINYLLENQEKWAKCYGNTKAHPDPEY